MLLTYLIASLLLCSTICSGSKSTDLNLEQALHTAQNQDQNIFVYFNADWCLPCQLVKEGLLADQRIQSTLEQSYVHVEVDIDNSQQRDWTEGYGTKCLPQFLVLNDEGSILEEISGTLSIDLFYGILLKYSRDSDIETPIVLIDNVSVSNKILAPVVENLKNTEVKKPSNMNNVKTITIGAFAIEANVNKLMQKMKDNFGYDLFIDTSDQGLYRLNIGIFESAHDYNWILTELKKNMIDHYVRTIKKEK